MNGGLIADIQRMSINDGPGMRTTVFFKGCPLNCQWCHNPECISYEKQTLFYPEKCIHCMKCDKGCYAGAKVICGKEYTVDELLSEILQDKEYYGTEGGVTFSGGEPLAQKAFLSDIIDACLDNGIHCAVETSLVYFDENIFSKLNLIMADLKIWNNELHMKYTGIPNTNIKQHFIMLNKLGIPIIARTPVIADIKQEINKISEFMKELENVKKYELLPYNPLGVSKAEALYNAMETITRRSEIPKFLVPDDEFLKEVNKYAYICG